MTEDYDAVASAVHELKNRVGTRERVCQSLEPWVHEYNQRNGTNLTLTPTDITRVGSGNKPARESSKSRHRGRPVSDDKIELLKYCLYMDAKDLWTRNDESLYQRLRDALHTDANEKARIDLEPGRYLLKRWSYVSPGKMSVSLLHVQNPPIDSKGKHEVCSYREIKKASHKETSISTIGRGYIFQAIGGNIVLMGISRMLHATHEDNVSPTSGPAIHTMYLVNTCNANKWCGLLLGAADHEKFSGPFATRVLLEKAPGRGTIEELTGIFDGQPEDIKAIHNEIHSSWCTLLPQLG